jgi:hypothetical protein
VIDKNCRLKKEPRFSRIVLEETFKVESGYIFKMAAQHAKLASNSLEKNSR